ncbi:unnamed protein product [Rhizophagus irregularis]|nr:unnamed protein product [Rhizophagus irregularis]
MIVSIKNIKNFDKTEIPIIRNEIFNLFINNNRNTKFLRLCFPQQFDYQLHRISGAEHCFSKLESFRCYANTNKYILEGLAGISKSIKKLIFDIIIISLETLKLFFDNWKNRNPMFLHIIPMYCFTRAEQRKQKQQELQQLENLIKEYKVKEIIKRYYVDSHGSAFEDFEWIQRRSDAYIEF